MQHGWIVVAVLGAAVAGLTGCRSAPVPETPGEAEALTPLDPVMARLERAVDAMGGAEVVDGVTSLELDGRAIRWSANDSETSSRMRTLIAFPDRYRQEVEGRVGPVATVLTPDGAFLAAVGTFLALPDAQAAWMRESLARNPVRLLQARHRDDLDASVEPVGDVEFVTMTLEGVHLRVAFDDDSGLLTRIVVPEANVPDTGTGEFDITFGDYREVGGLRYPFTSAGSFQGERVFRTVLEEVVVNPMLGPDVFTSPNPILDQGTPPPAATPAP